MRNVRRKITASTVLLSVLFLIFPSTQVTQVGLARPKIEAQGGLPQQDIDAINALAAFNIGTPYQPPQPVRPGLVVATEIGSDAGFPPLFNGPVKSVKEMLPLIREAVIRLERYYSGGTFLAPKPSSPPYTRKTYTLFHSRFANSPALARCEKEEGVGNCEEVKPNPRDAVLAYPKCKPGFTGAGEMCNPISSNANSSPKDEELISKVIRNAASDPTTRRKLAPYLLQVAWEALATNNPTPTQQAFYQYFQYYASWQNQMVTQKTLVQWCKHKKNWPKSPVSVLIGTNNAKSGGFKPEPMPMSIGQNGGLEVDKLLTPAIVTDLSRRDPSWQENLPNLVADGKTMDTVLTSLGFTGPSAAAVLSSMVGRNPTGWPGSELPLAVKVQDYLKEAAIKAAQEIGKEVAIKITEAVLEKLIGTVVGEAVGEGLGLPATIIAMALETLIKSIIAEVETPKFEAELIKGSREAEPVDVRGLIHTSKPGYGDSLKIGAMSLLIKMMIVDPADGTRFGPTQFVVIDPLQQALAANDVCGGLEQQGLLQ